MGYYIAMAKLTVDDVTHVAKLAKLTLTKSETAKFQSQLSEIINYIEELNEVDTKDVKPTSQTTGLANVFRKDFVDSTNILPVEKVTSGTDKTHNNYFVVDAVIDKDG